MKNSILLRTLMRPAQILVPFFIGLLCPVAAKGGFLVKWLLIIMLFNACLGIHVRKLKICRFHIRILIANLFMGIIPWLIGCSIWGRDNDLTQTLFYTGIAPTATSAPVIISFLGGEVEPMLTGFLLSNVTISVILIFLLPFVTGQIDISFLLEVLYNILTVMGIPLIFSRILSRIYPIITSISKKYVSPHALWAWSIMLFVLGGLAGKTFRENTAGTNWTYILMFILASFIIAFLNFSIGRILGKGNPHHEIEASQLLGQKNTMFIIFLAMKFSGPIAAIGPLCYILWHNGWNAIQLWIITYKKCEKQQR